MIPDSFIDELVRRNDILDVVSDYVRLSRKGANYFGLCPFHGEKTASFSVNQEKQIYHCFGCGKGGGVINFVMEIENLSFIDAVKRLAARANMQMPEEQHADRRREKRERILALNKSAAHFFYKVLTQSPRGEAALEYIRKRGITKKTMTNFGIGAAPDAWDALIEEMSGQGYSKQELLDAGLAVSGKEGRIYDRFRNRVMFPIIDVRGNVIGFGGRVLDNSTPKYLNSPDTLVFNKSRNLFALNIAKKSKQGRIVLTEGYMDVVSLHQAGFDCAVASLGTSLTAEHAQLISRYTKEVVIAYDSDEAGVKAAQRAIGILEKTGLNVKVLRMKGAKDPDEFIKAKGKAAFQLLLDRCENHIEYRLVQIQMKYDISQTEDKVAFLNEAVEFISSLPSYVEREIYGARVAEIAGVTSQAVMLEVKKAGLKRQKAEKRKDERKNLNPASALQPRDRNIKYNNIRSARAEEGIIRLALMDDSVLDCGLKEEEFSSPLLGKVFQIFKNRRIEGLDVSISALSGILNAEEMSHVTSVADKPESAENIVKALNDYIEVIRDEQSGDIDLLKLREKYREKKGYGG